MPVQMLHQSVLLNEVVEVLDPIQGDITSTQLLAMVDTVVPF